LKFQLKRQHHTGRGIPRAQAEPDQKLELAVLQGSAVIGLDGSMGQCRYPVSSGTNSHAEDTEDALWRCIWTLW
jgi:hypothetical protein